MKRPMYRQLLRLSRQFSTQVGLVRLPSVKTVMKNYPILSNAVIYGGLYTAAEVTQQILRVSSSQQCLTRLDGQTSQSLDLAKLQRYAVIGSCLGPLMAKWYQFIDKSYPSKATSVVLKKVTLDQFAFTPICLVIFFVGMAALEGYRGQAMFDELAEKGLKTFLMDCCFWIPNTAVNFLFIPAWLRVTFVAVSSYIWVNVLCWIKTWPVNRRTTHQT